MVARMRVATSGTIALSDDYGNSAPTAGLVLTSLGAGVPPDWALSNGAKPIYQVLFVDGVNGEAAATATGTLAHPFLTIPDALTYAVAQAWTQVQVQVAPGEYLDPFTVPDTLLATISGWEFSEANQLVLLGGNITLAHGNRLALQNLQVTANSITVPNPLADTLVFTCDNCTISADLSSFDANLEYRQSAQSGDILSTGDVVIQWDGWSWGRTLQISPLIPAAAARQFLDAGHSTYPVNLVAAGVVAGTTIIVPTAVSPEIRDNDRVQAQVPSAGAADFTCGVHSVSAGVAFLWLTNLTRAPGNFDDPVLLTVHHEALVELPAP